MDIFIPNKYTRCYFRLIERARERVLSGYKERHHIIPSCLGGSNTKDNLVSLTAREHFLCHLLLTKMCLGKDRSKMFRALLFMLQPNTKTSGRQKASSRWFELIRIRGNEGSRGRVVSEETRAKISASKKGKPGKSRRQTNETRAKISASKKGVPSPLKGVTLSTEHRAKLSAANMGKPAWNKGVRPTDEAIEKQRRALIGRKMTDDQKAKMSAAKKGKPPNNKGKGKHQLMLALNRTADYCSPLTTPASASVPRTRGTVLVP